MKIANLNLQLNKCSWIVAQILEDMETTFLPFKDNYFGADFTTKPMYNGRERGLVFSMKIHGVSGHDLNLWVYEHRNTDDICITSFEGTIYNGLASVNDIPNSEKKYENGDWIEKSFDYNKYYECAEYIFNRFAEYYISFARDMKQYRDYDWNDDNECVYKPKPFDVSEIEGGK